MISYALIVVYGIIGFFLLYNLLVLHIPQGELWIVRRRFSNHIRIYREGRTLMIPLWNYVAADKTSGLPVKLSETLPSEVSGMVELDTKDKIRLRIRYSASLVVDGVQKAAETLLNKQPMDPQKVMTAISTFIVKKRIQKADTYREVVLQLGRPDFVAPTEQSTVRHGGFRLTAFKAEGIELLTDATNSADLTRVYCTVLKQEKQETVTSVLDAISDMLVSLTKAIKENEPIINSKVATLTGMSTDRITLSSEVGVWTVVVNANMK